jgi:hypothetical protein
MSITPAFWQRYPGLWIFVKWVCTLLLLPNLYLVGILRLAAYEGSIRNGITGYRVLH